MRQAETTGSALSPRYLLGLRHYRVWSVLTQCFCACVYGARSRHRYAESLTQLDDGAHYRFDFHWTSGFVVLQHRGLVRADLFSARNALLDRDRQLDVELCHQRRRFRHYLAYEPRCLRMMDDLLE